MKIVYFTHSLQSCWNHGNAHFLRGVLRELGALGHTVTALEPENAWSLTNLLAESGRSGLDAFRKEFADLHPRIYTPQADVAELCDGADLVIVHEWNDPATVAAIGKVRRHAQFTLLFHDTHHRAVSDPHAMAAFDLSSYDGILAFGETLAAIYRAWGWGDRVWVWHEAADIRLFKPPAPETPRAGLVWIGNWGDGERSAELEEFLLAPAAACGLPLDIHGVRYADAAKSLLARYGARYRGWLPNIDVPAVFSRHVATVHVPRRFYVRALPGIPTIRVFEALACGIPLLSAPWTDSEGLFRHNQDFLMAPDGNAMRRHLAALSSDADLRNSLVSHGLETIHARHTCAHRARELLAIYSRIHPAIMEAV